MRLALIFNPFAYKVFEENIRVVQKYFGLFPPLSLAWVAAIAEQAGHEVIIIDARTLKLNKEDVLARLKEFRPDIMGFMMTTYMYRDTLEWITFFKKELMVPVVVGGYNLRVYPRESVVPAEIDFGVVEQAYYTVPALLRELEKGRHFEQVPGLLYKKDGKIEMTPHELEIDFDKFPNPARHLLPNELYAEFPTQKKNFTVMITSLGCPFKCTFCEAGGTIYSPRSPLTVAKEIEECYSKFKIREIDIFDYEFTASRNRVLEICNLIREKKLLVEWACRSRVDTVDADLLKEMKDAGCRRIYFGIESGSQNILDGFNKRITLKKVKETMGVCRDLGIQTLGFFLVGVPGETKKTVRQTLRFAKELDCDYVQFSKLLAKPLTSMWKALKQEKPGWDYWRDWILGKEEDRELPRPWTELSNHQINDLARYCYVRYHLRFSFILKSILSLKSFTEFKRKLRAFLDMVFRQERATKKDPKFLAYNENNLQQLKRCNK